MNKQIIEAIERNLYENLDLNEGNHFYLSHVEKDLFCVFTKKTYITSFFSDDSSSELNVFFKELTDMLLSNELNGDGCFDYEHYLKDEYSNIKNKANNYFNSSLNFILIKYKKGRIKPLSFFTYINGIIWTVCTSKKNRGKGYMTTLFKHFLKLLKNNELEEVQIDNNHLSLYLLKSNPDFIKTKKFYLENGFTVKEHLTDKIILHINLT